MTKTMITRGLTGLLVAASLAGAVQASGYEKMNPEKGQMIRAMLQEQGYEVRKIDMEDGMIEVYALKDGKRFELYLDNEMKIVRQKIED